MNLVQVLADMMPSSTLQVAGIHLSREQPGQFVKRRSDDARRRNGHDPGEDDAVGDVPVHP